MKTTHHPSRPKTPKRYAGSANRRSQKAQIGRVKATDARDIADRMVATRDAARYEACRHDLERFLVTYMPSTFKLQFSDDHRRVIQRMQQVIREGGLFALAMPRGSGKTSLTIAGTIWALLYAHRRFMVIIGSDEDAAQKIMSSIKTELEVNDLLAADHWEMCVPIRCLEGIAHRCRGQHIGGAPTHIGWRSRELILPTVAGCAASGGLVRVCGITGRIRGQTAKTATGDSMRPDIVLIDDPQTDEVAKSPSQVDERLGILQGAILNLAGPGKSISALMTATVIAPNDMADQVLDRVRHPEWQGERLKMLYSFPSSMDLWNQYNDARIDNLKRDGRITEATEFYKANRAAMDAGAVVAWAHRFNVDEASAVQNAMNLFYRDEASFFAEFQNTPQRRQVAASDIKREWITDKTNGHERGKIGLRAEYVTTFVDVQQEVFFWMAVGWSKRFDGYIADYGTFPEQNRRNYSLADIRHKLSDAYKGVPFEGRLYQGLKDLVTTLMTRTWHREDGIEMKSSLCLIDASWGKSTDIIYDFARGCKIGGVWPYHGRGVTAAALPFSQYKLRPGERGGLNWMIPSTQGKRATRHVLADVNFWKSFVRARLATPMGQGGCLTVFDGHHELLADHLTSETSVTTSGRGRELEEWRLRSKGLDNHWLDCLVGSAVGGSMLGCNLDVRSMADPVTAGQPTGLATSAPDATVPTIPTTPKKQPRQRVRYMNEQTRYGCVL